MTSKEDILWALTSVIEDLDFEFINEAIVKKEITVDEIVVHFRNELLLGIDL